MAQQTIQIDARLNETTALQLAADLNLLDLQDDVLLDFSATTHFEPFGMLLVSSAVRRLRRRAEGSGRAVDINPSGIDAEGLGAHMGFWQSMGLQIGRAVGAPATKSTYLPITRIGVDELYKASGGGDPVAGGVVEQRAAALAAILVQPSSPQLLEALTYALRELIRNVLDHAMTPAIWLAGMSWPKRNYVQVAVLDEGRGIRQSLATNPSFRFASDAEAIAAALQPGVSRNLGRAPGRQQRERYEEQRNPLPQEILANAGYGLHMISSFCREAGQFLLASGNAALAFIGSGQINSATGHHGTALRLVLHPSDVPAAWESLFEGNLAKGSAARKPLLSASTLRRLGLGPVSNGGGGM